MDKVIRIRGKELPTAQPSEVKIEINGVTSDATRSDLGDMKVLNKVNSIAKVELTWDYITIADAAELCNILNIDIMEVGKIYPIKKIEDIVFDITIRVFTGIRTFSVYAGDTISGTLQDYQNGNGQFWRNFSIALVGVGEGWKS